MLLPPPILFLFYESVYHGCENIFSCVRCRFAEKLAERYFKMVDQSKEEGGKEEEKEGKKEEKKDMHGLDLLQ